MNECNDCQWVPLLSAVDCCLPLLVLSFHCLFILWFLVNKSDGNNPSLLSVLLKERRFYHKPSLIWEFWCNSLQIDVFRQLVSSGELSAHKPVLIESFAVFSIDNEVIADHFDGNVFGLEVCHIQSHRKSVTFALLYRRWHRQTLWRTIRSVFCWLLMEPTHIPCSIHCPTQE